jgi:hypothetical protein
LKKYKRNNKMIFLALLAFLSTGRAWPACYIAVEPTYRFESQRLLVEYVLSSGSIGGKELTSASLVVRLDDPAVRLVLPETWPNDHYNATAGTIGAFAGCESRQLTGVVQSADTQVPVVTLDGMLQLMGGSVAWSIGAKRLIPGTHSWQQHLMRREGTAVASGCAGVDCVFAGRLGDAPVQVVFSPIRTGIGVRVLPSTDCVMLVVDGTRAIRINACRTRKVCRDSLCVPQLYAHGLDDDSLVVAGFDLLEEERRELVVYLSGTEMRVGFLFSSRWSFQTHPSELGVTVLLCLIASVFVQRPLVVQLDSPSQQRALVVLNMLAAVFVLGVMLYRVPEIVDGIGRGTGLSHASSIFVMVLTVGAMLVKFALIAYANVRLKPTSLQRNAIVRLAFSSMLCVVFIMHHCGVTERDGLMYILAFAAMIWLYNVPRILTETYVTFGSVWLVSCGCVLFLVQAPFVTLVGLETSISILNILDVPSHAVTFVFSVYIVAAGIFVVVQGDDDPPRKEKV